MYEPSLHDGVAIVDFPDKPGYLLEDMTDQAIGWVRQQQACVRISRFHLLLVSRFTRAPPGRARVDRKIQRQV